MRKQTLRRTRCQWDSWQEMEGWEEGQSGEVDRATQPLILANDCRMLTHTIAVICLVYHLYPCSALIDETSCLNATALEFGQEAEEVDTVHIVHKTTTTTVGRMVSFLLQHFWSCYLVLMFLFSVRDMLDSLWSCVDFTKSKINTLSDSSSRGGQWGLEVQAAKHLESLRMSTRFHVCPHV